MCNNPHLQCNDGAAFLLGTAHAHWQQALTKKMYMLYTCMYLTVFGVSTRLLMGCTLIPTNSIISVTRKGILVGIRECESSNMYVYLPYQCINHSTNDS